MISHDHLEPMLECLIAELVLEGLYNLVPGFINGLTTGNATLNDLVYEYVFVPV